MGRPPLRIGTGGKIRVWREASGRYTARSLFRDDDGQSRAIDRRINDLHGSVTTAEAQLVLISRSSMVGQQYFDLAERWPRDFQLPAYLQEVGS